MFARLLYWLVTALAIGLLGLLLVAPWLDTSSRLLTLFARDATVRKTALAGALGLLVTAHVFFRRPSDDRSRQSPRKAPPTDAVGA